MKLKGSVAVLTGAASGIGRALAIQLCASGCNLALVDRDEGGLKETVSCLPSHSQSVTLHICDLSIAEDVKSLPNEILTKHNSIDVLINNAGVALGGSFEQVSETDFNWLMRINFDAPVSLIRAILPTMRKVGSPTKIVNISSLFGLISPPGQAAYSASKFAVRGFSNALRYELRDTNVTVLVVHPGGIATSIADNAKAPSSASDAEIFRQRRMMNAFLKFPPQKAASVIIKAIENDKSRLLIGLDAKILSFIERLMPVSYWSVIAKLMKR
ncbi:SDR family NAD(P)-dependent oxidoreductase [Alteromonas sp. S015]|uniref:SDR family NAD(P)-dependent oxidoreductase n=1 Tax=Alteromonas sp. S015 TaxID=3117401 RepID=UPI002FDFB63A